MLTKKFYNGVEMPMLGFGTYQISDAEECRKSVVAAVKAGYRLIDTAVDYGNEAAVGAGIADALGSGLVKREDLFITTKVWFKSFETEDCKKSLETSFQKLGVEYLDMVLLHWPFGNVYAGWRVLEEYYEAGRIRAIGVSNMSPARVYDLKYFNKIAPMLNQIETHLYCQRLDEKPWLEKYGVAHQAYSPLGSGCSQEMFAEPAVLALAEKYGKTPVQILLRFLIQSGVAVIPKSVHEERIRENIDIFDFALTAEELQSLRALDRGTPFTPSAEDPALIEDAMTW